MSFFIFCGCGCFLAQAVLLIGSAGAKVRMPGRGGNETPDRVLARWLKFHGGVR
jgi:hypothetical protein